MEEVRRDVEQQLTDALIDRPFGFYVDDKLFYLFPVSLGKMLLTQPILHRLEINAENLGLSPTMEAMRVVKARREECIQFIAYHTCKTKRQVYDMPLVQERIAYLDKGLNDEDIATLLVVLLTTDKTGQFIRHLGIDKERDRLMSVMRVKDSKNSITFGGRSVYGTLIDVACERYGWTFDYVMWGISYTNLRLLIADKVNDVYLTDDELKKVPAHIRNKNEEVILPTKENMERILSMNWK